MSEQKVKEIDACGSSFEAAMKFVREISIDEEKPFQDLNRVEIISVPKEEKIFLKTFKSTHFAWVKNVQD